MTHPKSVFSLRCHARAFVKGVHRPIHWYTHESIRVISNPAPGNSNKTPKNFPSPIPKKKKKKKNRSAQVRFQQQFNRIKRGPLPVVFVFLTLVYIQEHFSMPRVHVPVHLHPRTSNRVLKKTAQFEQKLLFFSLDKHLPNLKTCTIQRK